jgi:hypothetical protein
VGRGGEGEIEIRNPKHEIRNKFEISNSKFETGWEKREEIKWKEGWWV